MEETWHDLSVTPVAMWVKGSAWAYPMLETAHVVGLGLLFGAIVMMDLRLLGVSRGLSVKALGWHLLPAAWIGFAINAVSGILLFISDAVEFAGNTAFRAKLALIVLAGLNALLFHARVYRHAGEWDGQNAGPPAGAIAAAVLSLILWLAVITAGRMIAYVE